MAIPEMTPSDEIAIEQQEDVLPGGKAYRSIYKLK